MLEPNLAFSPLLINHNFCFHSNSSWTWKRCTLTLSHTCVWTHKTRHKRTRGREDERQKKNIFSLSNVERSKSFDVMIKICPKKVDQRRKVVLLLRVNYLLFKWKWKSPNKTSESLCTKWSFAQYLWLINEYFEIKTLMPFYKVVISNSSTPIGN